MMNGMMPMGGMMPMNGMMTMPTMMCQMTCTMTVNGMTCEMTPMDASMKGHVHAVLPKHDEHGEQRHAHDDVLRWHGDDVRYADQGSLTVSNDQVEFEQGLVDPALVSVSGGASGGPKYRGLRQRQPIICA